ncbi:MAG: SMC-Scp complex subunit ScpB [Christensenellales bacterium]|jgi:segregation and condensation protein B
MLKNKIESLLFASGNGLKIDYLLQYFSNEYTREDIERALEEIRKHYSGDRGIILIKYNDIYQFQTNPRYGEEIAEILTPIKEKALSKTLLEVLAIVAYQQPVTRGEIEEIRGVDPDYACTVLQKLGLIEVTGRKDALGRPLLFGTTDEFLRKFGLSGLDDLPDKEYLLSEIRNNFDKYYQDSDMLFRPKNIENGETEGEAVQERREAAADIAENIIEIPEFLKDEDFVSLE